MKRATLLRTIALLYLAVASTGWAQSPGVSPSNPAEWNVKGDGVVCCPCRVPCPCRSNGQASYGHCEATLFLRIAQGHYQNVHLDGMQLVESGGMCAVNYRNISALYFDAKETSERREAYIRLKSGFALKAANFPHVESVPLHVQVTNDSLFSVSVPDVLDIAVDRNWGLASPPMPMVAAPDFFANQLQYVQNIRYWIHDPAAGLDFDYSGRQANYRLIEVSAEQYRTKSMLIQYADYSGWFSPSQLALIKVQNLQLPVLDSIRELASRLRDGAGSH